SRQVRWPRGAPVIDVSSPWTSPGGRGGTAGEVVHRAVDAEEVHDAIESPYGQDTSGGHEAGQARQDQLLGPGFDGVEDAAGDVSMDEGGRGAGARRGAAAARRGVDGGGRAPPGGAGGRAGRGSARRGLGGAACGCLGARVLVLFGASIRKSNRFLSLHVS